MPNTPPPVHDIAEEIDETTIEGYMMKDGIDVERAKEDTTRKGLDLDKVAEALGAKRIGRVPARSGYIGSVETLAAVQALKAEEAAKNKP